MFLVVGERINTSRKAVRRAVEDRDAAYIQDDVKNQIEARADYVDVNAGARIGHEEEDMRWLLEVIQEVAAAPLALDSPDPQVLEMAYGLVKESPMINSISLERDRWEGMLPFLRGKDCRVVALCMDDSGLPTSAAEVVERAGRLVDGLEKAGVERTKIHIDPLIQPIATDTTKGLMALESVKRIMTEFEGVHTICGLSNISYGMPVRKIINQAFLSLLMSAGLDGAIIDPLDPQMMTVVRTTEMLLGRDDYCMNFLKAVRAGRIVS